ncbi:transposase [Rhizobium lusitanum]|nr:transposase [Rhizobium lusitanum]
MAATILVSATSRRTLETWRRDYIESRPHTALGYLTPSRP